MTTKQDGCTRFPATPESRAWAAAAYARAKEIAADPQMQKTNLRHGRTWFVGVDALPNDAQGAVDGVPLKGPFRVGLPETGALHAAQLSVMYAGYPQRDPDQSAANHRYRVDRCAAHVDGLLPVGPERRRYPREFHAYILGIHVNNCVAAPTVYWQGSHHIMLRAIRSAVGASDPWSVDVTEAYQAARREVFDTCTQVAITGAVGEAFLLHRFALHGTAPWDAPPNDDGRMIAFFRPEFSDRTDWLGRD